LIGISRLKNFSIMASIITGAISFLSVALIVISIIRFIKDTLKDEDKPVAR
jgi:hypothetical protein